MHSLSNDYNRLSEQSGKMLNLARSLSHLSPSHQKLVAEIIIIRLFDINEVFLSTIAAKITCGALYLDGTNASLLTSSKSLASAYRAFQTHGKATPHYTLRWSKAAEIKENLRHIISPADNFITLVDAHGNILDEIRRVRNRIAHNSTSSRQGFRAIVLRHYGAYRNQVTPGTLLLSSRKRPPLLEQYIQRIQILAKSLVKSPN